MKNFYSRRNKDCSKKLKLNNKELTDKNVAKNKFPDKFPFWARLKISKNRTTLVIDEDLVVNKKTERIVDGFVHREATSQYHKGFEEIKPNPDVSKRPNSMFLKSPRKLPKELIKPHEKQMEMPQFLIDRYDKNNRKK